jgi:hypothetical protein
MGPRRLDGVDPTFKYTTKNVLHDVRGDSMGFRFRKSLIVAKGIRVNLSKSMPSLSIGRRGSTLNINKEGVRSTFGLPGTGLSYQTKRMPWASQTLRGLLIAATLVGIGIIVLGLIHLR